MPCDDNEQVFLIVLSHHRQNFFSNYFYSSHNWYWKKGTENTTKAKGTLGTEIKGTGANI